jgi:YcxB-like protein
MIFKFDITDAEYTEFIRHITKLKLTKLIWFYIIVCILGLLMNLLIYFDEETPKGYQFFEKNGIAILIFILVLLWYSGLRKYAIKAKIKSEDRERILGEREMIFEEGKILGKDKYSETNYQWNGLKKWEQTPNLYLIFIAEKTAFVVPKRIFETPQKQSEFESLLKRKINSLDNPQILDA